MNELLIIVGWIGLYAPVCLGAVGSAIGCTVAGQAAIGAMRLHGYDAIFSGHVPNSDFRSIFVKRHWNPHGHWRFVT